MANVVLYGNPLSTYVRSARIALAEKSVAYEMGPADLESDGYKALHPFAKMPAFRHGDYTLYETAAILRYVDEAFEGPKLQPEDARGRAEMEKWISSVNAYYDPVIVRQFLAERVIAPLFGRQPNEQRVKDSLPAIDHRLAVLDRELSGRRYLAGEGASLADILLLPMMFYFEKTPEGGKALGGRGNVARWRREMDARPAVAATIPPRPRAA